MFLIANKKMENVVIEERSLSDCVWSQPALLAVWHTVGPGLFPEPPPPSGKWL